MEVLCVAELYQACFTVYGKTETVAQKYFGTETAIGKTMTITFGDKSADVTVSGVALDVPANSTIQFDILMPINRFSLARGANALTSLGDFSNPIFLEFFVVFAASNIPAWIIGYIAMSRLLENYHYRISLDLFYFLFAGGIVLGVGLLTISSLSVKAALANPVNSLRNE